MLMNTHTQDEHLDGTLEAVGLYPVAHMSIWIMCAQLDAYLTNLDHTCPARCSPDAHMSNWIEPAWLLGSNQMLILCE